MSEIGPEQVTVQHPQRHRWLRRELWFVLAALVIVSVVGFAYRHHPATHVAPGAPAGGLPVAAPAAVPIVRPVAQPAS